MAAAGSSILETLHVSKSYGGTRALDDVSLAFAAGRVHAVVGRNGAGKSTLVRILSGATEPTAGRLLLDGSDLRLASPRDALRRGIATVHQELSVVGGLSVAENVLLGRLPIRRGLPLIHRHALNERAASILSSLGVAIDPRAKVSRFSFAEQQVVEIARALSFDPRAILLDEPTSALSRNEAAALFRLVRVLAGRGVAVIHVTHRLDELAEIADEVTALRDGRHVATVPIDAVSPSSLVEMMFGADADARMPRSRLTSTDRAPVLSARGLCVGERLHDVDIDVHPGEVLGIAGMLGSGRTELLMALFGATRATRGTVLVDGEVVIHPTPRRLKARGIALVPEDRKRQGLAVALSVLDNASLPSLARLSWHGLLRRRRQRLAVGPVLDDLKLIARSLDQCASTLSGGNQQKVVVGKWLVGARPRVLLLDEPTKGIDLEARRQLLDIVRKLADEGMAVVLVSSELEELLEPCSRIVVLRHGRIAGDISPERLALADLLRKTMDG